VWIYLGLFQNNFRHLLKKIDAFNRNEMAKSRRVSRSRRASRRNRRASRRAAVSRSRRGGGLFAKLYSPVHQVLGLGENAVSTVTNTVNSVAKTGLRGVNRLGRAATGRTNAAISGLLSRRRRGGRR
jgi:hypothetical protein